jgi:hypothetical protein
VSCDLPHCNALLDSRDLLRRAGGRTIRHLTRSRRRSANHVSRDALLL